MSTYIRWPASGSIVTPVAINQGGTGQTTANAAFNALAPSQTGNSGKFLTTDGTNTSWATASGSLPSPLTASATYASNEFGTLPFIGVDSSINTPHAVLFGSTDGSSAAVPTSTVYVAAGDQMAVNATAVAGDAFIQAGSVTDAGAISNAGVAVLAGGFNSGSGTAGNAELSPGYHADPTKKGRAVIASPDSESAQLQIAPGTLTTTPVPNTIENDATNLYYTNGAGSRAALGGGGGFVAEVHIGPQCTTQSSTISATTTFTTFSNSPTLTFTPTNSGTFRVTFAPPLLTDNAADVAKCQVILTAGAGATLLAQTIGVINNSSAGGTGILTCYTEAIYTLVAGTSYSFNAQGCTVAGTGDTEIRCNWGPANIVAVRIA